MAGDASAVQVYDSEGYKLLGEIKVSIDADSIAYDPATHYLYVVNGGREAHTPYSLISVIDTDNSKKLRDIKIDTDHVEAIVLEKSGPRMFLNLTGKSVVGVLDRNKSEMSATWPLPPGDKLNVAMAFDEPDHRLFVTTRNPGKLIVLNSDNGKVITSLPAVGMIDDMSYDAQHKRLFSGRRRGLGRFRAEGFRPLLVVGEGSGSLSGKDGHSGAGIKSLLSRRPSSRE